MDKLTSHNLSWINCRQGMLRWQSIREVKMSEVFICDVGGGALKSERVPPREILYRTLIRSAFKYENQIKKYLDLEDVVYIGLPQI